MYSTTYADLSALIERLSKTNPKKASGANQDDAQMLAELKRITMIHSDTEHVVRCMRLNSGCHVIFPCKHLYPSIL